MLLTSSLLVSAVGALGYCLAEQRFRNAHWSRVAIRQAALFQPNSVLGQEGWWTFERGSTIKRFNVWGVAKGIVECPFGFCEHHGAFR